MTLQASGAISLANIAGEFGGTVPHSINEYYKNGGRVPSSLTSSTVAYGTWSSYSFQALTLGGGTPDPANVDTGVVFTYSSGILSGTAWWSGGVYVGATSGTTLSFLDGGGDGFEFQRGSVVGTTVGSGTTEYVFYNLRARSVDTTTSSITVNANVPTSGAIDFNDFYGGRAS